MDIGNTPLARQMRDNYFRSQRNGPATTGSFGANIPLPQRKPDVHIKAPVNVTITINGVTDPAAVARQIKKQLSNELGNSLRGSFND